MKAPIDLRRPPLTLALLGATGYFAFLVFFYYRYVPLIVPFQAAFLPVLLLVFVLTLIKTEWGFLAFVAVLPLTNNLPYFFGVNERIPHAPTALSLFLVFFFAWWLRRLFLPSPPLVPSPLGKPLRLLSVLIVISAAITFWRYTNFAPFLSDGIHEIIVNDNSLRAGGALMSIVFGCLSYISGFLFYVVAWNTLRTRRQLTRAMLVISISISGSLIFALLQKYNSLELGNSPAWIHLRQINATFKDPNSFGAVLTLFFPVLLGLILYLKKGAKLFPLMALGAVLLILPSIGSRSALLGIVITVLSFLSLLILDPRIAPSKRTRYAVLVGGLLTLFIVVLSVPPNSSLSKRLGRNVTALTVRLDARGLLTGRADLWTVAARMIRDYPLTGVGEGSYIVELPNYLKVLGLPFPSTDSAENYFLQIGAELGLIGLALTLWLFWSIIKSMISAGRGRYHGGAERFLMIGALSGTAGLFINFLFHSYLGAFEVQYIFWLWVAVITAWPASGGDSGGRARFRPGSLWAAIFLVSLYAGLHLWSSTHSLSLTARTDRFGWNQDFGLYEPERDNRVFFFRWAKKSAGMTIPLHGRNMVIPILVSHPDVRENPVHVRIFLADDYFRKTRLLKDMTIRHEGWTESEYQTARPIETEIRLVFESSRSWEPAKVSNVPDPRRLAVGLGEIWFKYPDEWQREKAGPVETMIFRDWEGEFGAELFGFGASRIKFFSEAADSALRLRVKGQTALDVGPLIVIRVDGDTVAKTMLTKNDWECLVLTPGLSIGEHELSVEFKNDFYDSKSGLDRNVFLGPLEILTAK